MLKFNYFCIKEICGTNRALCSFKKYRKGKLPKVKNDIGVLKSCNVLLQYLLYKQITNYLYVSILIKEISNVASLRIFLFEKGLSQESGISWEKANRRILQCLSCHYCKLLNNRTLTYLYSLILQSKSNIQSHLSKNTDKS